MIKHEEESFETFKASVRKTMDDLFVGRNRDFTIGKSKFLQMLNKVRSYNDSNCELTKYIAKRYFIFTASFHCQLSDIQEAWNLLSKIGFIDDSSQLSCMLILSSWYLDAKLREKSQEVIEQASTLLENHRSSWDVRAYTQMAKTIREHRVGIAELE